jgi:hypothetical protein
MSRLSMQPCGEMVTVSKRLPCRLCVRCTVHSVTTSRCREPREANPDSASMRSGRKVSHVRMSHRIIGGASCPKGVESHRKRGPTVPFVGSAAPLVRPLRPACQTQDASLGEITATTDVQPNRSTACRIVTGRAMAFKARPVPRVES